MGFESIASKPIHFFDVPEVKNFSASFVYNFFVPDESIDESGNESLNGNLSDRFLRKGTIDNKNINSRVPRYVELSFSLGDTKKKMLTLSNSSVIKSTKEEIVAALNSGMVITEDDISSLLLKTEKLGNDSVDKDLNNFMSLVLTKYMGEESTVQQALKTFAPTTSVNSDFISSKMIPPSLNTRPNNKKFADFLPEVKKTKSNIQINSAYAPFILRRPVESGTSLSPVALSARYLTAVKNLKRPTDMFVTEDENVLNLPSIAIERQKGVFTPEANVIAVIFEKKRIFGGKKYPMPAVIAVGSSITSAYDSQVAYGQTYEYVATTLAKVKIPVTTTSGKTYSQTVMIASRPSQPKLVTITEERAPQPPQDINYHFEYGSNSLFITWAPPINPQRDVKYYQVFRRKTVDVPFELIANLDFDNSVIRSNLVESIGEGLTTSYSYMPTFFVDADFQRSSSYIYALVSVDARQFSSPYSTQIKVTFDSEKNKIRKELISYAGAPKQYPNWELKENFFVDSMKDSSHSNVSIYFNPEAYTVLKGNGESFPAFYSTTVDPLSKYVFQFINTDRLLEKKFEVKIDDSNFRKDLVEDRPLEKDDDE